MTLWQFCFVTPSLISLNSGRPTASSPGWPGSGTQQVQHTNGIDLAKLQIWVYDLIITPPEN